MNNQTEQERFKNLDANIMSDRQKHWLIVALEEYKSLRTESLTAMANQQATLRFGTGTLGVALTLAVKAEPVERFWVFSCLIPMVSLMFFSLYAIEFGRMVRVGTYIDDVEGRINKILDYNSNVTEPEAPLGWETWLARDISGGKITKDQNRKHLV
jgi:hypothetical protein